MNDEKQKDGKISEKHNFSRQSENKPRPFIHNNEDTTALTDHAAKRDHKGETNSTGPKRNPEKSK